MRKRLVPVLAALLLLTTACARAPARPVQPAAQAQSVQQAVSKEPEVTTLKLGVRPDDQLFDQIIPAFQEAHPNIRVEKVPLTFTEHTDLIALAKRGSVDLIPATSSWTFGSTYTVMADLTPYLVRDRFDTAPFGTLMAEETVSGKVYGLPIAASPSILVYNKRLAAEAGVTIPAGWTWDQFRTTIAKLTRGTGNDKIYGLDMSDASPEDLVEMLAYGLAGGKPDTGAVREALTFWNGVVWDDHSAMRARPLRSTKGPVPDLCNAGQAVICFRWGLSYLTSGPHAADFHMAPLPSVPGRKPVLAAGLRSYGITFRGEKEAAWEFLSFAAGPEGQSILARQGQFPIYASDATRRAWAESTPPPPAGSEQLFDVMWRVPPHITGTPKTPDVALYEAANGVLSGQMTLDVAVAHFDSTQ